MAKRKAGKIFVGVGGWNFAPWRGSYYPKGLTQAQELHYSSRELTSIEINSTFYGLQKPATFKKWHDETPDGFVFSVKAPRFVTHRKTSRECRVEHRTLPAKRRSAARHQARSDQLAARAGEGVRRQGPG